MLHHGQAELNAALGGHILVVDGEVVGGWRRELVGRDARIELKPMAPLEPGAAALAEAAIGRYRRFLGTAAPVTSSP